MLAFAGSRLLIISGKERTAVDSVLAQSELRHGAGSVALKNGLIGRQLARMGESFFSSPYVRLPKDFKVARPGIHRHFFLPFGSHAIIPGEFLTDLIGDELAVVNDAIELRPIVDTEPIGMHVRRRYAERFPVHFF